LGEMFGEQKKSVPGPLGVTWWRRRKAIGVHGAVRGAAWPKKNMKKKRVTEKSRANSQLTQREEGGSK